VRGRCSWATAAGLWPVARFPAPLRGLPVGFVADGGRPDWARLPEALGLSFALLGAMLATGAWASARFPYSVPQEGYKNVAPGQAGPAWISLVGGMVVAAALCVPVIALTVRVNAGEGGEQWRWPLLPAGTAYGAALTLLGLRPATPRTAGRLPEILTSVSKG